MPEKSVDILGKFLKKNLLQNQTFNGHSNERSQVFELIEKTIKEGESNSALLIGPKGSGKTTLVNDVVAELHEFFDKDAVLVRLHGLVHTDDRLALKGLTMQMALENAADGKVFGSFADNLAFLLACLKAGDKTTSRSVVVILDEFDLFCTHRNQTLLYNLFDVSQSAQTPICVLGITCRLDVIELLEKRVKSRFSHRQIFLFMTDEVAPPRTQLDERIARIEEFLTVPNGVRAVPATFRNQWNAHVTDFVKNKQFRSLMQRLLDLDMSEATLKNILLMVVCQLSEDSPFLALDWFQRELDDFEADDTVNVLRDLSVVELCLIIAMKHHCDIYGNQAMNFEMVYTRYMKFSNSNSGVQNVPRAVLMKAFEHIEHLQLINMVNPGTRKSLKEYQLFKLLVFPHQVDEAIKTTPNLPTEVAQWGLNSAI